MQRRTKYCTTRQSIDVRTYTLVEVDIWRVHLKSYWSNIAIGGGKFRFESKTTTE